MGDFYYMDYAFGDLMKAYLIKKKDRCVLGFCDDNEDVPNHLYALDKKNAEELRNLLDEYLKEQL